MKIIIRKSSRCFLQALILSSAMLPFVALPGTAQIASQTPPSFEVASVRSVGPDHGFTVFPKFPASQFVAENISLKLLIAIAYGINDNAISAEPGWLDSTYFTVKAKPEGDTPLTAKQYRPLLQQLLKERFKLAVHQETRDVPGYALVVAKGGPKLTPAEKTDAMAYILSDGLQSASVSLKTVASLLSRPLGHPVIDKTGVTGTYKLNLSFAPTDATESPLPSIFTAVQEQLGLKLESQKVPATFLVIDHVEKLPTETSP